MSVNSFEDYPLSWRPVLDREKNQASLCNALAERLEQDILAGKLLPGTKLPPQRELADYLDVGLSTVTRAFRLCRQRGLLCSSVGSGTFVASDATENSMLLANVDEHNMIDLGSSTSSLSLNSLLTDSLKRLSLEPDLGKLLRYGIPGGSWISRQAGAKWMELSGYRSTSDRILVAAGAQNALAGCVLGLFQPGDRLAVRSLTYQGVRNIARVFRLQLVPLPEEAEEFTTKGLLSFFQREKIKGVYLIPDYHNPTARVMPLTERQCFAEAIEKSGIILIEDGSHSMLMQRPMPPILSMAPEHTIYIAGFSKVLAPGLRAAFIDCPPPYRTRLVETLYALNVTPSPLLLQLVDRLIINGKVQFIINERKRDLKERNQRINSILQDCPCTLCGDEGSPVRWMKLPFKTSGRSFEAMARAVDVQVYGAERFAIGKKLPEAAVRLSVAAPNTVKELETGIMRLRNLLQQMKQHDPEKKLIL